MVANSWKPISRDALVELLDKELRECPPELIDVFDHYSVDPYQAPIDRFGGETNTVFVVARKNDEVMYFNDIEWGWNFSPIDENGKILQHWCNQDELKYALWQWIDNAEE